MPSPWPKSVLVSAGTPVDIFAADGVEAATRTLLVQNVGSNPVRTGYRENAPGASDIGNVIAPGEFHFLSRAEAPDTQWLWIPASAARVVYQPYIDPTA